MSLTITSIDKMLNIKGSVRDVTSGLDLRAWTTRYGVIITVNTYPTFSESYWLEGQRDLYCCLDALYLLLKSNFKHILINWFLNLPQSVTKGYTMRCIFFRYGLKFNLHDFLHDYCFLNVSPIEISEKDNKIVFKAKVVPLGFEEIENIFIEPRPKRW